MKTYLEVGVEGTILTYNFHQTPTLFAMTFLAASAHFKENPECCQRDLVSLSIHHF